jgi:integrase
MSDVSLYKTCDCSDTRKLKCGHSWYLAFKWGGVYHRPSIDKYAGRHIATKGEALELAEKLRDAIKAGTWVKGGAVAAVAVESAAPLTLRALATSYVDDCLRVKGLRTTTEQARLLDRACETTITLPGGGEVVFGELPAESLTVGHISAFKRARLVRQPRKDCRCGRAQWATCSHAWRAQTAGGRISLNRTLARLRACLNWAVREQHISKTPFRREGVATIDFLDEEGRDRRLTDDEETRLLAAAGSHLAACIIASLEAALRLGEVLSLQWKHVSDDLSELRIVPSNAKSKRLRVVPVSARLKAVLELRRLDPEGETFGPDDYVFGNAVGERIGTIKKAWELTVKRAGLENLHFHDLRRTGASRLLESGHFALHDVRNVLGHQDVATTNRYLAGEAVALKRAMMRRDAALADARQAVTTVYVVVVPPMAMPVHVSASAIVSGYLSTHSAHEGYRLVLASPMPDGDLVPARLSCSCGAACDVTVERAGALAVLSEMASAVVPGQAIDQTVVPPPRVN